MSSEINKLYKAIQEFRKIYPEINAPMILTFLYVAMHPNTPINHIATALDYPRPTVSRYVSALSKARSVTKRHGYDLLQTEIDPVETRRKMVNLTPKGKKLKEKLLKIIGD